MTGLLTLLLGGPLLLLGLWSGTTAAVGLAAQVLSPAERVERIKVAQADYTPPQGSTQGGTATLKGVVRIPGDRPPPRPIDFHFKTSSGNGSTLGSLDPVRGDFAARVRAGTIWLALDPDDYAPVAVGPFGNSPAGRRSKEFASISRKGSRRGIRVIDEHGRPISGVE